MAATCLISSCHVTLWKTDVLKAANIQPGKCTLNVARTQRAFNQAHNQPITVSSLRARIAQSATFGASQSTLQPALKNLKIGP